MYHVTSFDPDGLCSSDRYGEMTSPFTKWELDTESYYAGAELIVW